MKPLLLAGTACLLLAACDTAPVDSGGGANSGTTTQETRAGSGGPRASRADRFENRAALHAAIAAAFPYNTQTLQGCASSNTLQVYGECQTRAGTIYVRGEGDRFSHVALHTGDVIGEDTELERFLGLFGINDPAARDWAIEIWRTGSTGNRDAGSYRLSAGTNMYEQLQITVSDKSAEAAKEREEVAIATSTALMSPAEANADPQTRAALLMFKHHPALLNYDGPLSYFAAINNLERFERVRDSEFDWPAMADELRDGAPALLDQISPTIELQYQIGLGPYDRGTGAFPVYLTASQARARARFNREGDPLVIRETTVPLARPDTQLMKSGPAIEQEFPDLSMFFGRLEQSPLELDQAVRLEQIPLSESRARAFAEQNPGRDSFRDVTLSLTVKITQVAIEQDDNSMGRIPVYYGTSQSLRVTALSGELLYEETL